MDFVRPQHKAIATALRAMDAALLERTGCFFAGGTAIVLANGEYRLSADVDFLCSNVDGYRELRLAGTSRGIAAFFGDLVTTVRALRTDQYGIRGVLAVGAQHIKFEIVREARIASLSGARDPVLGVPVLSIVDQFAEKMLANADRGLDRAVAYRDVVDLGYLVKARGCIPQEAIDKASAAYGSDVPRYLALVLERLAEPAELRHAATTLDMAPDDVSDAAAALTRAAESCWPDRRFAAPYQPT